jgi:hypothetical protein
VKVMVAPLVSVWPPAVPALMVNSVCSSGKAVPFAGRLELKLGADPLAAGNAEPAPSVAAAGAPTVVRPEPEEELPDPDEPDPDVEEVDPVEVDELDPDDVDDEPEEAWPVWEDVPDDPLEVEVWPEDEDDVGVGGLVFRPPPPPPPHALSANRLKAKAQAWPRVRMTLSFADH